MIGPKVEYLGIFIIFCFNCRSFLIDISFRNKQSIFECLVFYHDLSETVSLFFRVNVSFRSLPLTSSFIPSEISSMSNRFLSYRLKSRLAQLGFSLSISDLCCLFVLKVRLLSHSRTNLPSCFVYFYLYCLI